MKEHCDCCGIKVHLHQQFHIRTHNEDYDVLCSGCHLTVRHKIEELHKKVEKYRISGQAEIINKLRLTKGLGTPGGYKKPVRNDFLGFFKRLFGLEL